MSVCQKELMDSGQSYPRTCPTCQLGPCHKMTHVAITPSGDWTGLNRVDLIFKLQACDDLTVKEHLALPGVYRVLPSDDPNHNETLVARLTVNEIQKLIGLAGRHFGVTRSPADQYQIPVHVTSPAPPPRKS